MTTPFFKTLLYVCILACCGFDNAHSEADPNSTVFFKRMKGLKRQKGKLANLKKFIEKHGSLVFSRRTDRDEKISFIEDFASLSKDTRDSITSHVVKSEEAIRGAKLHLQTVFWAMMNVAKDHHAEFINLLLENKGVFAKNRLGNAAIYGVSKTSKDNWSAIITLLKHYHPGLSRDDIRKIDFIIYMLDQSYIHDFIKDVKAYKAFFKKTKGAFGAVLYEIHSLYNGIEEYPAILVDNFVEIYREGDRSASYAAKLAGRKS